jgi:hypothetical protein
MRVVVIGHVGTFLVPRLVEQGKVEAEWTSKASR